MILLLFCLLIALEVKSNELFHVQMGYSYSAVNQCGGEESRHK